ncbi:MAG: RING finger domain-containing protein [Promethearchaeota archaeon]
MAKQLDKIINKVHDIYHEKERLINDSHYRRYLPLGHKLLRLFFQVWLLLVFFSVVLIVLNFSAEASSLKEFFYICMEGIFYYSLFILALATILFASRYTVPIAVTNEIKAKRIVYLNNHLDSLKDNLIYTFFQEIKRKIINPGKLDLSHVHESLESKIKLHFPQVKYIKEYFENELLKYLEDETIDYLNDIKVNLKAAIGTEPKKIEEISKDLGIPVDFVISMLDYMISEDLISGDISDNYEEFIPGGFVPSMEEQIKAQQVISETAYPDQQITPDETPSPGIEEVSPLQDENALEIEPSSATTNQDAVDASDQAQQQLIKIIPVSKARKMVEDITHSIELLKQSYEAGEIGVDSYLNQISEQEEKLKFYQNSLDKIKNISSPTTTCISCAREIDDGSDVIKCPNGHVFHEKCGKEYLQHWDKCPICWEKITYSG